VRVWDTRTGQQVERLRGHKDSVYSVAFSPDGNSLVSGSLDKSLKVWDLRQTRLAAERAQPGHPSPTGLGVLQQTLVGHKVSHAQPLSRATLTRRRTTCYRSESRQTGSGSCPGPRIEVYSSGKGTDRRSFCCRDTRTRVSLLFIAPDLYADVRPVISIDLAKSGNLFASGSGDCHARVWQYTSV
jgi:glucose repression regulatory protein TUP1